MDTLLGKVSLALGEREFDSLGNALDQYEVENPELFDSPDWPFAVHMLAHIYTNNLEDARFVYKRIPTKIKARNTIINAALNLLQRLWVKDFQGIWPALAFPWPTELQGLVAGIRSQLQHRMLLLVQRAYSSISVATLGALLGVSEQEAVQVAALHWHCVPTATGFIDPPRTLPSSQSELEPSQDDLQKLAQYAVFLQSGVPAPSSSLPFGEGGGGDAAAGVGGA